MTKPLIISDCDEVLLHMVVPFGEWLEETQRVSFKLIGNDFSKAIRDKTTGEPVPPEEIWRLLNGFFDGEMHRQTPIAGAISAINTLKDHADVVILTNLTDRHNEPRAPAIAGPRDRCAGVHQPGPERSGAAGDHGRVSARRKAMFIDDLAQHHGSVAEMVPHIDRLHLCGRTDTGAAHHLRV
jgi:hypothetical protein